MTSIMKITPRMIRDARQVMLAGGMLKDYATKMGVSYCALSRKVAKGRKKSPRDLAGY